MQFLISLPVLIFSAILHEVAHGYVADRLGDPTARLSGRLTLNPLRHIDLYMSILLPLALILSGSPIILGGAKPVPIDPFNFREGKKDTALVSLAGPLTNIILAVSASLLLHGISFIPMPQMATLILSIILSTIANYNILLAIFNLLPIPPLDGSKIFALLLPDREAAAYLSLGSLGIFLILILFMFPIGGFSLQTLMFSLLSYAQKLLGI